MFFIRLLSRLPLRVLYVLSDFLFVVSYYLVRYRRRLVRKNLANSFPEKTAADRRRIEREFYRNLCDYAVEALKLLTMSREELTRRIVFKNTEAVHKYLRNGQPVLQLACHQFNWEWVLAAGSLAYPPVMDFVYQPVNNKFFDNLTTLSRTRFGAHAIKRDEVAREIARRKGIVRSMAIVADQYPGYKRDKKYAATFLQQPTVFFYGSNQMAQLTQWPVVFQKVRKVKRGHYEATTVEVGTPPYTKESHVVIDNYIQALEKAIGEDPSNWLWSHNRWKTRHLKQASVQYPPSSAAS